MTVHVGSAVYANNRLISNILGETQVTKLVHNKEQNVSETREQ